MSTNNKKINQPVKKGVAKVPVIMQMGFREEDITVGYRKEFKPFDISRFLEMRNEE